MMYLWALLSCGLAVGIETYYRGSTRPWAEMLPLMFYPIMALNYCICQLVRTSPSLVAVIMIFSLGNLVLRAGVSIAYLKEPVPLGTWVAMGLMVMANLIKNWRK